MLHLQQQHRLRTGIVTRTTGKTTQAIGKTVQVTGITVLIIGKITKTTLVMEGLSEMEAVLLEAI